MLTCKNLEFPFVKIPQGSNEFKTYLDKKLECVKFSKSTDTINTKEAKIYKINDFFKVYKNTEYIFDNYKQNSGDYYPVFLYKTSDKSIDFLIDSNNFDFAQGVTECALCMKTNILGFKKSIDSPELNLFGRYPPQLDNVNLIFRNFLVVFNGDPYMPNHLMLISQNHDANGVKGSQYEMLNREVISDVVDIFFQVSTDYVMGCNYILSGSQKHFHVHMIKKLENVNYGLDNLIDLLADSFQRQIDRLVQIENTTIDHILQHKNDNTVYKLYINKDNIYVRIACFKNNIFGYTGYLITMSKNLMDAHKQKFVSVIFNFLNYIEKSIEYSFNLYFPSSDDNLSIVVLVQSRKKKSIISFINLIQFIYGDRLNAYSNLVDTQKELIKKHVLFDVFPDEDIWDILYDKPVSEGSIYSNSNLRQIIYLPEERKLVPHNFIVNFTRYITDKPSVSKPKIIIINGPIGSGKSRLFKNLKLYFPFYDESTYVHVNVDNLIMSIPGYKKLTQLISDFFKSKYLTKNFNTYDNVLLHKYGDKSIKSLNDNNFMNELDINDYEYIYDEMFNDKLPNSQETIKTEYNKYYNQIETYRTLLLQHILQICMRNKFNYVIENARISWLSLNNMCENNLQFNLPNIYYLGYDLPVNDFNQKFILRNVLQRNIEEGRLLDFDLASLADYSDTIKSYKKKVVPDNFILINLGYTFLVDTRVDLKLLKLTKDLPLDSIFDSEICVQSKIQDMKLKLTQISSISKKQKYLGICLNVSKSISDGESIRQLLKNLATSINNKYLLDENTISLLIYNTVININSIIQKVVIEHNTVSPNQITIDDIKVILKGGLNIRYIIKDFFSKFEKHINIEQQQLLNSIIKSMDSTLDYTNLFKNTTSKSDIDFTIIINKTKITKQEYDTIRTNLRMLYIKYLLELRKLLSDTNFFGSYHSVDKLMKDSDKLLEMDLTKMEKKNNYNFFIDYPENYNWRVRPEPNPNNVQILYAKTGYLIEPLRSRYEPESHYYVSYQNLFIEQLNKKLDIIRLRNCYQFKMIEDDTEYKIGGEIIDLTILDYDSANSEYFDKIKKVKYTNNMYNFEFNIFDEDFLMPDILRMLFYDDIFPWKNPKIDKRFSRYLLLLLVKYFKQTSLEPELKIDFAGISTDLNVIKFDALMIKHRVSRCHILYDLLNNLNNISEKIQSIRDNPQLYSNMLHQYGYDDSPLDYDALVLDMNKFFSLVASCFKHLSLLVELCESNINKTIIKEISQPEDKVQLVQWGGFQRLYSIYKNYYMELKGGSLFNPAGTKINTSLTPGGFFYKIDDLINSHMFTQNQIQYIELLFLTIIKNVTWKNSSFSADISTIKPLSCGGFGCGFLLNHSPTGEKFIIKICGANSSGIYYNINNSEYLKEIFGGHYITSRKPDIFNKTYGYFITSTKPEDAYFKSIDSNLKYTGAINNSNPIVQEGNILAIFMSAGDGDLYVLIRNIKERIVNNNTDDATINALIDTLISINRQLFEIGDITSCSNISKKCIYLTHNDIKLSNIIFKYNEHTKKYKIEYIDYGTFIFSDTFFSVIGLYTPNMMDLIYNNLYTIAKPTSPLFDIASAIYTMFILLGSTYDPYSEYDANFEALRSAYVGNNLNDIKRHIKDLIDKVCLNIRLRFFSVAVATPAFVDKFDKMLTSYKYIMAQYINLAMCIYKYHYENILPKSDYSNYIFSIFEILEINYELTPIKWTKFGTDLTDKELLKTIMDYVKGKISIVL